MTDGKQDEFDRILDAALAKYAAVEPRDGLKDRVLANLRAERARVPDRAWWRWTVMAGLAVVVVAALALAWKSGRPSQPVIANHSPTTAPSVERPGPRVASAVGANDVNPKTPGPATRRVLRRARPTVVAAANPTLDQFPSPRPLSEEEQLLVRYVQEFPEEAVMMAKAQAESEKEIERLIGNQPPGKNPDQPQDQQER